MKALLLTPLMLLSLAHGRVFAAPPRQPSARAAATRFYRTYLKLKVIGLPDAREYRSLSPFFSPELRRLFEAARVEQDRARREHPDEKPPWGDGDLFTSLHEGAQAFRVGRPRVRGKYAEVPVRLEYRGGGSVTRWEDTLVLVRTRDGWRVWDILHRGEWAFKSGSSLRSILSPN